MCGIAGELIIGGMASTKKVLSMSKGIAHRGPDANGYYRSSKGNVVLAHRRLSILDPTTSGNQPMLSVDGNVALIFNGEIYNYKEIKREIESAGTCFRTGTDTEVILEGYRLWGEHVVKRLRGMFAFAIWDERNEILLLARDRIGIKPLFVCTRNDQILFCSELDPLRDAAETRSLCRTSIGQFLKYRYVGGRRTIWKGIDKLLPGEYWIINGKTGNIRQVKYWNLREVAQAQHYKCIEDAYESVEAELKEAVRLHLRSDVDIGVLLSGGVDSSVILALASEQITCPLYTFSMGFGEARTELPIARETAIRYGTIHNECTLERDQLEKALHTLGSEFGNPLADSSAVAYMYLSKFVSKYVKVALGGDGGDELFGGYKWYHAERALRYVPKLPFVTFCLRYMRAPGVYRLLKAISKTGQEKLDVLHGIGFDDESIKKLLCEEDINLMMPGYHGDLTKERRARVYDLASFTVDSVLYKVDVASMREGLEVRVPFLDHRVIEESLRIPAKGIENAKTEKIFLRTRFKGCLVESVTKAKKTGFSLPLRKWEQALIIIASRRLENGLAVMSGLLKKEEVSNAIGREGPNRAVQVWTLLVFEEWLRSRYGWI